MNTHNTPSSTGPAISVVMPVYNAREYLPFTLRNIIVDQFGEMHPGEWELIAIDDGSTDGSHLEIEPWIEKYPHSVKLIRKPNGGPSSARNAGLAAARGTYVYFCDSDDIILRGALTRLLALAAPSSPDLIKFYSQDITAEEYNELIKNVPSAEIRDHINTQTVNDYLKSTGGLFGGNKNHLATWLTIYKRHLLSDNNILYNRDFNNGEDELFTWDAILTAKTVFFTPTELYLYNLRNDSISHPSQSKKRIAYDAERIRFAAAMQDTLRRINASGLVDSDTFDKMTEVYMHTYYRHMTSLIVNTKASLLQIYKSIRCYRKAGGRLLPHRIKLMPYQKGKKITLIIRLRRIIAAYILDHYES